MKTENSLLSMAACKQSICVCVYNQMLPQAVTISDQCPLLVSIKKSQDKDLSVTVAESTPSLVDTSRSGTGCLCGTEDV